MGRYVHFNILVGYSYESFFKFTHWARTWVLKCSSNRHIRGVYIISYMFSGYLKYKINRQQPHTIWYEIYIWVLNIRIQILSKVKKINSTKSHQEVMFISSLQAGGVVPLESTRPCATLTAHKQHWTKSPNAFRASVNLTYTYSKTQNKIHTQYMNRALPKEESFEYKQVQC